MKTKKRTRTTYEPGKGTKIKGQSMAVQNDCLSVADMLRKHIAGEKIPGKDGVYVEDANHEDPDAEKHFMSDPFDREMVVEGIKAMTERLRRMEKDLEKSRKETLKKNPEIEPKTGV